jgi:hypothetical protein
MSEAHITLDYDDPVVFAKCGKCSKTGPGSSILSIFYKAYPRRRWDKHPTCENCGSQMVLLYQISEPGEKR